MPKLIWDKTGEKTYETGTDHAVLYQFDTASGGYKDGVAWNGITAFNSTPSGAENTALWADNIKYLNIKSAEEYGATIEAYTYPVEFGQNDGTAEPVPGVYIGQQNRKPFGFSVRTLIGNDTEGQAYGYKLHLIYGAEASPSEKSYATVNDSPEAITFSWEIVTTPVNVTGDYKPTAHIEIDSTLTDKTKLAALEEILYGSESAEPRLPMPDEVITLLTAG